MLLSPYTYCTYYEYTAPRTAWLALLAQWKDTVAGNEEDARGGHRDGHQVVGKGAWHVSVSTFAVSVVPRGRCLVPNAFAHSLPALSLPARPSLHCVCLLSVCPLPPLPPLRSSGYAPSSHSRFSRRSRLSSALACQRLATEITRMFRRRVCI